MDHVNGGLADDAYGLPDLVAEDSGHGEAWSGEILQPDSLGADLLAVEVPVPFDSAASIDDPLLLLGDFEVVVLGEH